MQILRKILKTIPFIVFVAITQAIQTAGVILIAVINNAPIECIFIYLGMVITRNLFGRSFHAKTFFVCTAVTWSVFYLLTAAVPPLFVSIYSAAFLGIGTSCFMNTVQTFLEFSNRVNNLNKIFKLEVDCDKTVLIEICNRKNMTAADINLLVEHYANNKSYGEMQTTHNYSERHLRRLIRAAEEKFYK